ncbi:MAG: hypothetical protein QOG87_3093 [Actinomycetota bacterium]|jgi:predicted ATPase/DNA-binding SARP family transcriptional activator
MRVGLLGAIRVDDGDDAVDVPGAKQRALLALLAVNAGTVVSDGRVLDELWGDALPDNPANALQKRVSELRKLLGADRVIRRGEGYVLEIPRHAVDSLDFEDRVAVARTAEQLSAALALWRGPALAELADLPFARAEAARLEELRWAALEDRVEADLELGRHHELSGELPTLVKEQPLRERLRCQLMLALYRSGRQAEALRTYSEGREVLAEELGLDPGPQLRAMEFAILEQDPSLALPDVATAGNLPAPVTTFVGREAELRAVADRLEGHRLVTLTGPGGAGKTRLALEVARGLVATTADGVWLAELAPSSDPRTVAATVAVAVGAGEKGDDPVTPLERTIARLRARQAVVVLDNCEHVIDAAADVASAVLAACPDVRIIATSREPLGIAAEAQVPVPALGADDAARLFAERAEAVRPDFDVDVDTAADVARLCEQLDGLPLAIELAAARVKALPVGQIVARLQDRFRLLSGGARDAAARHRTLRAAVEWSYDLLFDEERTAFRQLAVFPGSFDLEAAEAVCVAAGIDAVDVIDLVGHLVDKSLVVTDGSRYRMLETLRQFGVDRLEAAGELRSATQAHAEHFISLGHAAGPHLTTATQVTWLDRLDREVDNMRAALGWVVDDDPVRAMAVLGAITLWMWPRGYREEARSLIDTALRRAPDISGVARCRALRCASHFGNGVERDRRRHRADERTAEALALAETLGDEEELAGCQRQHAITLVRRASYTGDLSVLHEAGELVARSEATFARLGQMWGQAIAVVVEVFVALAAGDLPRAERLCDQGWPLAVASGERFVIERILFVRALAAKVRGDVDGAIELHEQALAVSRELGFPEGIAVHRSQIEALAATSRTGDGASASLSPDESFVMGATQVAAGRAAWNAGDLDRAEALYREALAVYDAAGMRRARASVMESLAQLRG